MRTLIIGVSLLALSMPVAHAQQSTSEAAATQAEVGTFFVPFDFGRAALNAQARQVVAQAAEEYKRTGTARVIALAGHADRVGTDANNRRLSERRVESVQRELVRLGVPETAVSAAALGETNPPIPTEDGVAEPRNRVVEIRLESPADMAPTPVAAAENEEPPRKEHRRGRGGNKWELALGGIYGHNFQEDDDGSESDLAGIEAAVGYALTPYTVVSFEQAGFYSFNAKDEGYGGRSVVGFDLQAGMGGFTPYIGVNVGAIYGESVQDGWVAGPEAGVKVGLGSGAFIYAKGAYDYQFRHSSGWDEAWDEGIVLGGLGAGWRF